MCMADVTESLCFFPFFLSVCFLSFFLSFFLSLSFLSVSPLLCIVWMDLSIVMRNNTVKEIGSGASATSAAGRLRPRWPCAESPSAASLAVLAFAGLASPRPWPLSARFGRRISPLLPEETKRCRQSSGIAPPFYAPRSHC